MVQGWGSGSRAQGFGFRVQGTRPERLLDPRLQPCHLDLVGPGVGFEVRVLPFSSYLLLSSLELSDTTYGPYIRASLGTASHFSSFCS